MIPMLVSVQSSEIETCLVTAGKWNTPFRSAHDDRRDARADDGDHRLIDFRVAMAKQLRGPDHSVQRHRSTSTVLAPTINGARKVCRHNSPFADMRCRRLLAPVHSTSASYPGNLGELSLTLSQVGYSQDSAINVIPAEFSTKYTLSRTAWRANAMKADFFYSIL